MNILLTSVGRRTYMIEYFKSALNKKGKVFASNSIETYTLKQADEFVITPNIYDLSYIDYLLDYCLKNNITVIIPLFDVDLFVLASNKLRFIKKGIQIIVSDKEMIDICNDKWKTFHFLSKIGVKQPKTYINYQLVKNDLLSGVIKYPLIIKPRWGMGSIGIYTVSNDEELRVFYKKLGNDIFKTYLRYESKTDKENCVIIQEIINGEEYGMNIFNDLHGNFAANILIKKISMRAGETDVAQVVESKIFNDVALNISQELKHIGNLDVDCFLSDEGEIIIIELNCRFGGQYPFIHLAGVDFPKQIIDWINGKGNNEGNLKIKKQISACKDIIPRII